MGSGGAAALAGQMGPQVLLPEEIITVPTAFAAGMTMGNAKTNMEIEGGRAYLEMLDNGVSEETARAIATGVGAVNAGLEFLQIDELIKAYKVLDKAGADDAFMDIVLRELKNRGIDTAVETRQEVMQEGATIAGAQLGSKIDTGEWAYNLTEMLSRLWDTAKESALTFGLTNIPSIGHNVVQQSYQSENGDSISFPAQDAQLRHIFRDKTGHFEDTPENRHKILEVTGNKSNYLGKDSRGNDWYAVMLEDGRQMWVRTRNGLVDNAGINDDPRIWDSQTGLYNNTRR